MDAKELAGALGAVRSGRQYKCLCVAHEDRNPSMIIFDGRETVQVRCMAGCDPRDIIAVLQSRGLWHGGERQEITQAKRPENLFTKHREHRMRLLARGLFDEAKPIHGSLAQIYFESRELYSVAHMIEDIRFHPSCPRYSGEQFLVQPAIIIAMRSITTNALVAIQRIFLTKQGRKDGKGMMLGGVGGAAMKLQHLQNHSLHICEGLETGLALIAMDEGPVWALGSAIAIQNFPVIASVDHLTIWADHDEAGLNAAKLCGERWLKSLKAVDIKYQERHGWDQCDVWRARNGRE